MKFQSLQNMVLPTAFMVLYLMLIPSFSFADSDGCKSTDAYEAICGIAPPEDMEVTPDGRFLFMGITPGMDGRQIPRLQVMELATRQTRDVELQIEPESGWGEADCAPPSQPMGAHGIHLSTREDGRYQLLVVNHSKREAIEFLEIEPVGEGWKTIWRGCVENSGTGRFNDVSAHPDGGFVATVMFEAESMHNPPPLDDLLGGRDTGYLMAWSPERPLAKIEGSDAPFPNGIQVSPNGRYAWYAAWTAGEVHRFDLAANRVSARIPVDYMPDNLSWGEDGLLLAAGIRDADVFKQCFLAHNADCPSGFKVSAIDPDALSNKTVFQAGQGVLPGVSVALEIEGDIYVGAFNGDRMIRLTSRQD
ncbi:SMP-30/gluconolactonase/LRE family protein [Marinobacter pelagius]|uniref:SMP-30/gluconolactonase/LRE family protein n=1 Tax=Marinobacter sp. C7 TaxID=2951363 RepID=UPI001EF15B53|nr:SMP-30/gluconolactonase/LRE family protein [Marinobacter sp. C7]MCG7200246.1 SMP-30/gluconolactonase/LRE family protein [Marinobacter sp. C7]